MCFLPMFDLVTIRLIVLNTEHVVNLTKHMHIIYCRMVFSIVHNVSSTVLKLFNFERKTYQDSDEFPTFMCFICRKLSRTTWFQSLDKWYRFLFDCLFSKTLQFHFRADSCKFKILFTCKRIYWWYLCDGQSIGKSLVHFCLILGAS